MYRSHIKRTLDFWIGIGVVLVFWWVMLIAAIAIYVEDPGPVLFRQKRLGLYGKEFMMLKFRSMIVNAEKMGAGLFNYQDDPRVTKVGRFLRDSSLDELPQLINILLGDMSVVGPRPCVTYELGDFDTLNKKYKKRFEMKAGLTGLAQVKGRNDIQWDEKVVFDNQYIDDFQRLGILADFKIIGETFLTVFKKEHIYEEKADDSLCDEEAARKAEEEIIRLAHLPD